MTIGMVSGGTITYWTTMAYLPTYITAVLKYPLVVGLSYGTFVLLIYMLAVPFAGILCDRIGRRPTMLIAYGSIVVLIWPMFYLLTAVKTPLVLFPVLVVVAIIPALFLAGQTAWLTEAFPTSVRGSACGVGYNIGVAIFGGSTPFMATWLISMTHDNMSPTYYMMLGGLVSTLIVYFFVRETNRREL
jgi:MHS family proline/betaine transporter-like MFS transporter